MRKLCTALALALTLAFCLTGALAEGTPVSDLSAYAGAWVCIGDNDSVPYLWLHDDGTLEAYNWWQYNMGGEHGALLYYGAYQLDAATGAFSFPGDSTVYTLSTIAADDLMTSSDGFATADAGTPLLLLSGDSDILYMPLSSGIGLLPTAEDLDDEDIEWFRAASPDDFDPEGTSDAYSFRENGEAEITSGDETVPVSYALSGGRLDLTVNGQTRRMYLQYYTLSVSEMSAEDLEFYAENVEDDWSVVLDPYTIQVLELKEDGSFEQWWLAMAAG